MDTLLYGLYALRIRRHVQEAFEHQHSLNSAPHALLQFFGGYPGDAHTLIAKVQTKLENIMRRIEVERVAHDFACYTTRYWPEVCFEIRNRLEEPQDEDIL